MFPSIDNINPHCINDRYISNNYPDFYKYLMSNYPDDLSISEKIYWYYNGIKEYPLCPVCGTRVKYKTFKKGYSSHCSLKCSSNSPEVKQKSITTKIIRYGDPKYNNRDKAIDTCIKKYGEDNPFKSNEIKDKIKQTMLDKYGVEYAQQSKEIQKTREENSLKKYGVKHHMMVPDIKDKAITGYKNHIIDNNDDLLGYTPDNDRIMKCPHSECKLCEDKYYIISSKNYFVRKEFNIEPCTKILPITFNHSSNTSLELFVQNILNENGIPFETNNRTILGGQELDIYIPGKQIAIECNGIFWHSEKNGKPSNYHINKYIECKNKGIQLITIWEDQIKTKPEIVKSIILSKLGIYGTRIYARKCIIKEIDSNISTNFLNENHIQGRTNAKIKLGLYYDNELVSVMTFSKMSKLSGTKNINDNEWELGRFCNKLNTQVIGGASKLLKYFIANYNPSKIISFASNDISNGNLYKQLGFNEIGDITKAYWYIHKQTYQRYHRSSFTKSKLYAQGYDINMTEKEIMSNLPYLKIYDSGHIKYELKIEL